jgi:hypothetical protein
VTDEDPDDIAYIGNEEDIRGPGCLIGLSAICSCVSFLGSIASCIWLVVSGLFAGGLNALINAGFGLSIVLLILGLSIFTGGFGLGLGLYAVWNARFSEGPNTAMWGRLTALIGGLSTLFAVAQIVLMILIVRGG